MTPVSLASLISSLQSATRNGGLSVETVNAATQTLADLGHGYDYKQFPPLKGTESFGDSSGDTPLSLAEALLWKLGKWKAYKGFAAHHSSTMPKATKNNVVLFAFAMHLKDKRNPIYDQHAMRALWAIDTGLTLADSTKCKSLLFDSKSKWKDSGSGKHAVDCYEIFVRRIKHFVSSSDAASLGEIDRLLMPLGQAIKEAVQTYSAFQLLCDWSADEEMTSPGAK
ncbi:hypothetical protein [Variovorax boronicumulans]